MKPVKFIKSKCQKNPEAPLSAKEKTGLVLGLIYLLGALLLAARFAETWIKPSAKDDILHKECVLIAISLAKVADSAYKDTYDLCRQGKI